MDKIKKKKLRDKVEEHGSVARYVESMMNGREDIKDVSDEIEEVIKNPVVFTLLFTIVLLFCEEIEE